MNTAGASHDPGPGDPSVSLRGLVTGAGDRYDQVVISQGGDVLQDRDVPLDEQRACTLGAVNAGTTAKQRRRVGPVR